MSKRGGLPNALHKTGLHTAGYSPLRRREFTSEETDIYLQWMKEAFSEILPLLKKNGLDVGRLANVL